MCAVKQRSHLLPEEPEESPDESAWKWAGVADAAETPSMATSASSRTMVLRRFGIRKAIY